MINIISYVTFFMGEDQITPTRLALNITPLNNVLTDIILIKSTVGLIVYIIQIIYVKLQTNLKSLDMLLRHKD
jgi:hypothetical protein